MQKIKVEEFLRVKILQISFTFFILLKDGGTLDTMEKRNEVIICGGVLSGFLFW